MRVHAVCILVGVRNAGHQVIYPLKLIMAMHAARDQTACTKVCGTKFARLAIRQRIQHRYLNTIRQSIASWQASM